MFFLLLFQFLSFLCFFLFECYQIFSLVYTFNFSGFNYSVLKSTISCKLTLDSKLVLHSTLRISTLRIVFSFLYAFILIPFSNPWLINWVWSFSTQCSYVIMWYLWSLFKLVNHWDLDEASFFLYCIKLICLFRNWSCLSRVIAIFCTFIENLRKIWDRPFWYICRAWLNQRPFRSYLKI